MRKSHTHNTTKFKLVCYYSHDGYDKPYTSYEKSIDKNRKYHDSFDYEFIKGGITITRHDKAFDKLLAHIDKHWWKIDRCFLFMNDFEHRKEIKIGIWDKFDNDKNRLCDIIIDRQGNHFICIGVQGGGIESYNMRIAESYSRKQYSA